MTCYLRGYGRLIPAFLTFDDFVRSKQNKMAYLLINWPFLFNITVGINIKTFPSNDIPRVVDTYH